MIERQISIFLENKLGAVAGITSIFARNSINIRNFHLGEASEFGIMKIITCEPDKAFEALRREGIIAKFSNVIGFRIPNVPGTLSSILTKIAKLETFIEYMYGCSQGDYTSVILKPEDSKFDLILSVIKENPECKPLLQD